MKNIINPDGSRLFFGRTENLSASQSRALVESLDGGQITKFLTDIITEFWLDFSFQQHQFTIHSAWHGYWFFVKDASCPPEILEIIIKHFSE